MYNLFNFEPAIPKAWSLPHHLVSHFFYLLYLELLSYVVILCYMFATFAQIFMYLCCDDIIRRVHAARVDTFTRHLRGQVWTLPNEG